MQYRRAQPNPFESFSRWLDNHVTPAVKWILLINCAVTLGMIVLGIVSYRSWDLVLNLVAEDPALSVKRGFVWQFVTYMFTHVDVMHLIFNMLALYFFGPALENRWGTRDFWRFYMITGIGAGLCHAAITLATGAEGHVDIINGQAVMVSPSIIGASGAIFGVMLAYAAYYPEAVVYVWGALPVKIKILVPVLVFIELGFLTSGRSPGISHLTHLTGAGVAYLLLAHHHRTWDIRRWQWSRR